MFGTRLGRHQACVFEGYEVGDLSRRVLMYERHEVRKNVVVEAHKLRDALLLHSVSDRKQVAHAVDERLLVFRLKHGEVEVRRIDELDGACRRVARLQFGSLHRERTSEKFFKQSFDVALEEVTARFLLQQLHIIVFAHCEGTHPSERVALDFHVVALHDIRVVCR